MQTPRRGESVAHLGEGREKLLLDQEMARAGGARRHVGNDLAGDIVRAIAIEIIPQVRQDDLALRRSWGEAAGGRESVLDSG